MTFTIDTREPWPHPWGSYFSGGIKLTRSTLETGDLCVAALPDGVVVERKTAADAFSSLGRDVARFEAELKRGRLLGRLVVVVESNLSDVLILAHHRGGLALENAIVATLANFQHRYCPFMFAGSPRLAAEFCERLLRGQVQDIRRASQALAMEGMASALEQADHMEAVEGRIRKLATHGARKYRRIGGPPVQQ